MAFGDFSEVTFVNGTTPAINATNLNAIESKLEEIDDELSVSRFQNYVSYKNYGLNRSYKLIDNLNDASEWTNSASSYCTISTDRSNTKHNGGSIKITRSDSGTATCKCYKNVSSLDLSKYANDVDSAGTDARIVFVIYISDATKIQNVTVRIGTDSSNHYYVAYSPGGGLVTGYNALAPAKTDFGTVNSPNGWDDIDWISIEWASGSTASGAYVSFDFIGMYRPDPTSAHIPNIFQKEYAGSWTGMIVDPKTVNTVYFDTHIGRILFQCPACDWLYGAKVNHSDGIVNFTTIAEYYCLEEDEIGLSRWWIDSSNYVDIYIASGTAYLYLYESGSGSTVSQALASTLEKYSRVILKIEKEDTQIRVEFYFEAQPAIILESVTTISSAGVIYLGGSQNYSNASALADFAVSNRKDIDKLEEFTFPQAIYKLDSEARNNTESLSNDSELFVDLPPNGMFAVELIMSWDAASTSPGIDVAWTKTGDVEEVSYRHPIAIGPNSTSNYNAETTSFAATNFATERNYGTCATGFGVAREKFLVRTGSQGGRIQLQWAQHSATAEDVTLQPGSCILVDKVTR
jgi:hypothetical protein